MKRKRLRYTLGQGITTQSFRLRKVDTVFLQGYVSCVTALEMKTPWVWTFHGVPITAYHEGYHWFRILQTDARYSPAAIFDDKGEIVLWYIDIIAGQGIDDEGQVYFDDLYLDLIVLPNGEIFVDDMDELEQALATGDITEEQFNMAIQVGDDLQKGLLQDMEAFRRYTNQCYAILKDEEPDEIMTL